jgi:hypothetical protein
LNIDSSIALMTAMTDLKVVQAITGAMKANLLAAGGVAGPLGTVQMPAKLPKAERLSDTVEITGRVTVEPTPRVEPRPVIRPEAQVVDGQTIPIEPEMPSRLTSPIPPVWKTMPKIEAEPKPRVVTYEPIPNGSFGKGRLVDVFV